MSLLIVQFTELVEQVDVGKLEWQRHS